MGVMHWAFGSLAGLVHWYMQRLERPRIGLCRFLRTHARRSHCTASYTTVHATHWPLRGNGLGKKGSMRVSCA